MALDEELEKEPEDLLNKKENDVTSVKEELENGLDDVIQEDGVFGNDLDELLEPIVPTYNDLEVLLSDEDELDELNELLGDIPPMVDEKEEAVPKEISEEVEEELIQEELPEEVEKEPVQEELPEEPEEEVIQEEVSEEEVQEEVEEEVKEELPEEVEEEPVQEEVSEEVEEEQVQEEVSGEVEEEQVQEEVSGEVEEEPVQEEVSGEVEEEPVQEEVSEEVEEEQVQEEVSEEVEEEPVQEEVSEEVEEDPIDDLLSALEEASETEETEESGGLDDLLGSINELSEEEDPIDDLLSALEEASETEETEESSGLDDLLGSINELSEEEDPMDDLLSALEEASETEEVEESGGLDDLLGSINELSEEEYDPMGDLLNALDQANEAGETLEVGGGLDDLLGSINELSDEKVDGENKGEAIDSLINELAKDELEGGEGVVASDELDSLKNLASDDESPIDLGGGDDEVEEISINIEDIQDEPEEDEEDGKKKKKKKPKKEKGNKKKLSIADLSEEQKKKMATGLIAGLVGLIVTTAGLSTVILKHVREVSLMKTIDYETQLATYLKSEDSAVYFTVASKIDEEFIIVDKIDIEQTEMIINFTENLTFENYNIKLEDNNGNVYNVIKEFPNSTVYKDGCALKTSAIKENVEFLNLTFESLETGNYTKLTLPIGEAQQGVGTAKIGYIYDSIEGAGDGFTVSVDYAEFTDKNTRINYSITPDDDAEYQVKHGLVEESGYLEMVQSRVTIANLGDKPIEVEHDGSVYGRMDFDKVTNKTSTLVLEIDNLYKKFPVNGSYGMNQISDTTVKVDFDKYTLELEGLYKFDKEFVVVFNTTDNTISTENRPETFNRIKTSLDAKIVLDNGVSTVVLEPTEVRSAQIGTDLIFTMDDELLERLDDYTRSNVTLEVAGILLQQDSVYIPIDSQRILDKTLTQAMLVEDRIVQVFQDRLKDGIDVAGVSTSLASDPSLDNFYNSLNIDKSRTSSVDIIYESIKNNTMTAIIQEAIPINTSDVIDVKYVTHMIQAIFDGQWIITYDEII